MNSGPADGQDLFDDVDSLARLIGGPVTIEDVDFRVLAYSAVPGQADDLARRAAILNRKTPERWLRWISESGLHDQLAHADRPIHLHLPWVTEIARHIQPITHSGHIVGYLWLMNDATQLSEETIRVVREFAERLAPELAERLRHRPVNPGGRALSQFFAGVLPARALTPLLEVDELDSEVVVIAVQAVRDRPSTVPTALSDRAGAQRALTLYADLQLPNALVALEHDTLFVLMAAASVEDRTVTAALDGIVAQLRGVLGAGVIAGAGRVHTGLAHATDSRFEAQQVLHVLRAGGGEVSHGQFETLRCDIVLQAALDAVDACGPVTTQIKEQLGAAGPLRDEQLRTLGCYFDAAGDIRTAARNLRIHPNTLRYRLRRVEQMTGLDLSDSPTRLALELVLKATGGDTSA